MKDITKSIITDPEAVKKYLWFFLCDKLNSKKAAAAILGNIWQESNFIQYCCEGHYDTGENSYSYKHTQKIDNGTISKGTFETEIYATSSSGYNSRGYGLCQWTHSTEKGKLYDFSKQKKDGKKIYNSIGSVNCQVDFLWDTMNRDSGFNSWYPSSNKTLVDIAEGKATLKARTYNSQARKYDGQKGIKAAAQYFGTYYEVYGEIGDRCTQAVKFYDELKDATPFKPRLNDKGLLTSKYYKPGEYNTYPLVQKGTVLPNCVGYAYGRFLECAELEPKDKKDFILKGNGGEWWGNTNLPKGAEPKAGAIVCWAKPGDYGHVAFVEKDNGDGTWFISHSGLSRNDVDWNRKHFFKGNGQNTLKKYHNGWHIEGWGGSNDGYVFQGFIYNPYILYNSSTEIEIDYAPTIENVTQESDNDLNCIVWENKDTITITGYVNGKEDITTGLSVYISWDDQIPSITKYDINKEIKLEKNKKGKWVAVDGQSK